MGVEKQSPYPPLAVQLGGHYYDGRRFATVTDAAYADYSSALETAIGQSLADCEFVEITFHASGGSGASWFRLSDDSGTTHTKLIAFSGPGGAQTFLWYGDTLHAYRGAGTSSCLFQADSYKLKG